MEFSTRTEQTTPTICCRWIPKYLAGTSLAFLLLAGFWLRAESILTSNGSTFDELPHLAAGYGYWTTGDFRLNREHPPLLKLWWALPIVWSQSPPYPCDVAETSANDHWKIGIELLERSGRQTSDLLRPARRMNILIGCGILLLVARWAARFWGSNRGGVLAAIFASLDPNLLALSCVLSTDIGLTFFALLTAYLLWEYSLRPARFLLLTLGISLGLLLSTKFSAIAWITGLVATGTIYILGGGVLALPSESKIDENPALRKRIQLAVNFGFRLAVIAAVTLTATYGFVNFDQWGAGLKFQLTRSEHGDGNLYLLGDHSKNGWFSYFLIVLALKLPIGLIIGAMSSVPLLLAADRKWRSIYLVLPPTFFFIAASLSRVDLGLRVILPSIPVLYILGGGIVVSWRFHVLRITVAAGLLIWMFVSSSSAMQFPIAYTNEFAGGTANAYRRIADSNLDWGQGLPALKHFTVQQGIGPVYLAYFGTDRPEVYGIRFSALPGYGRIGPEEGEVIPLEATRQIVVVSGNLLYGLYLNDPNLYAFLRSRTPIAILASSLFVFDICDDPEAICILRGLKKQ